MRGTCVAQRQERGLLSDPDVGVGGVAEQKPVEAIGRAGRGRGFDHRAQPHHHRVRIFVIGRQQHRGAARQRGEGAVEIDRDRLPSPSQGHGKAGQRRDEGEGDPGEQDAEQHEHQAFEHGHAADLDDLVHLGAAHRGQRGGGGQNERATDRDPWPAAERRTARHGLVKRRSHHLAGRLGGQEVRSRLVPKLMRSS